MAQDILLNTTNDLEFSGGDFVTGQSEMQEVAAILQANQGEYKEFPLVGANLMQYSNSKATKSDIERRVRIQLLLDGKEYGKVKNELKTKLWKA